MPKKKKAKQSAQKEGATTIIRSGADGNPRDRLLIVTPTLGNVRMEWAVRRYSQVVPCNWASHDVHIGPGAIVPMHYLVADAQNIAADHMMKGSFQWLLFWEDDVIPPPNLYVLIDEYIRKETVPVVSGLYFLKTERSEPVCYRGLGTRCFVEFKLGQKHWVDGVPTGMLLVHRSIIELMSTESEPYKTLGGQVVPKVFETPSEMRQAPDTGQWQRRQGTSDLAWCRRIINEKVFARAGWKRIGNKKWPFLLDTRIYCSHIDLSTGRQYPSEDVLRYFR